MNNILQPFLHQLVQMAWLIVAAVAVIAMLHLAVLALVKNPLFRALILLPIVLGFLAFAFSAAVRGVPPSGNKITSSSHSVNEQPAAPEPPKTIPSKNGGTVPAFTVEED